MAESKKENKKGGILSNWIVRNLILAVVFVVALLVIVNILLNLGTQHNKEITAKGLVSLWKSGIRFMCAA